MANLFDYLDWRGDISFDVDPFNEVDNLVLSWMSYVCLDDVMMCGICYLTMTIKEACDKFFSLHTLEEKLKEASVTRTSAVMLKKMGESKRFQNIKIINYVNKISEKEQKQFAAMTFELDDNTVYVAFRGTDDSIVGWREDFNMSFLPNIPAQLEASEYVNKTLSDTNVTIMIGGHSKGGNLAVYSAMHANDDIKKRIIKIYNNDGPGFLSSTVHSQEYQEILPKIQTFLPESSVVGMLFEHEEAYEVVRSSEKGIMQHSADSWEVLRNRFVSIDSVSYTSKILDKSVKEWIDKLDDEQRQKFVEGVFALLESSGAKTTGDLYNYGMKNISSAIKTFGDMDSDMQKVLMKIIKSLLEITGHNMKNSIKKEASSYIKQE